MSKQVVGILGDLAKFLQVSRGKITCSDGVFHRIIDGRTTTGVLNIVLCLLNESNSCLKKWEKDDVIEIRQWLEYALVYCTAINNLKQVLSELNAVLESKSFLVENTLTIVDVFLYYSLVDSMASLSNVEKETYVNLSRWFDNLQQDEALRQNNDLVNFNTINLLQFLPLKH